jgi:hypothetical protein
MALRNTAILLIFTIKRLALIGAPEGSDSYKEFITYRVAVASWPKQIKAEFDSKYLERKKIILQVLAAERTWGLEKLRKYSERI